MALRNKGQPKYLLKLKLYELSATFAKKNQIKSVFYCLLAVKGYWVQKQTVRQKSKKKNTIHDISDGKSWRTNPD